MALIIRKTGLDQYAPGGEARLKTMFIGGPGVGKTRLSSFWPRPFIGDCEGGLASIADRATPFVSIRTSQDMLEYLSMLKTECMRPWQERTYQTAVIDTLDAFQRKVKDEWLLANNAQAFRGYDAWGYLDAKMQMLLTRLLNLDMNVIVNVHYKDKTIREGTGENASERQELMLQLSGEVKDSVFNDFDLVGWIGTYWDKEDGERVEKRGLTFKRTPDKPFLKDRLFITPKWMEVKFSDDDYSTLFSAFIARLDEFKETEDVGEVPTIEGGPNAPTAGVRDPVGGALPPVDPKEVPLSQWDKPTLVKMARAEGVEGIKTNTLKGELIAMIEAKRAEKAAQEAAPTQPAADQEATASQPESDALPASATEAPVEQAPAEVQAEATPDADSTTVQPAAAPQEPAPDVAELVETEVGKVNKATGEVVDLDTATQTAAEGLGAEVVSEEQVADEAQATAPSAPATAPSPDGETGTCEEPGCGRDLADQNPSYVKLGRIKFRKQLCEEHFLAAKAAA